MRDRIYLAIAFAMTVAPAFAQLRPPIGVPEPATIAVFGLGAAGLYVVRKFTGKK